MKSHSNPTLLKEQRALVELPKVAFFKAATENFLREVSEMLEPVAFLPGNYIIRQGEAGDCMYFITDGTVEVIIDGKQIAVIGQGGLFGEMSLISGEPRNASIRAIEHCGVYKLSKAGFDALRLKYPNFDRSVTAIVRERSVAIANAAALEKHGTFFPKMSAVA
jgi:voltage-gated potassium channel